MKSALLVAFGMFITIAGVANAVESPRYFSVTGDKVRLRAAPSLEGAVVATHDKGTLVERLEGASGEWAKVRVKTGGAEGWMHMDYLSAWLVAGLDDNEAKLGHVSSDWDEGAALVGQFPAGQAVTLVGKGATLTASTGEQLSLRNECAGSMLHLTRLSNAPKETTSKYTLGVVGGAEVKLLDSKPVTDSAEQKAIQAQAVAKNKIPLKGFSLADAPLLQAGTVTTPDGKIQFSAYASPEKAYSPEVQNKYLAVQFNDEVFVAYTGCDAEPLFFQIGPATYFTYDQSTCETDEHIMFVVRVTKDGFRTVYLSYAHGC